MPSIRSENVVFPDGTRPATVHFEAGTVQEITDSAADVDFGDLWLLPGLVDSHVHVNEPGRTTWEGFESATRAAAAGGTTTIVDMPLNSIPPTVSTDALEEKRSAAKGKLSVDVAFWGGLIPGSEPEVPALVEAGVCGFKSFMVDSGVPEFPPMTGEQLAAALPVLADRGVPSLLHAEDPAQLLTPSGDPRRYHSYLESRPVDAEAHAVRAAAEMARASGARVHILHISSAEAVEEVAVGGLSGETCPHYLTFCAEDIADGATPFKCAPPIRSADHREELWNALVRGDLNMVVSDHSPAPGDIKALDTGDFATAWGGVGSLQLRLLATWTGAEPRGIELATLAGWLSLAPAQLAGLDHRKGSIEVGRDADLVVFDPDAATLVRGAELEHRHPITPYEGMKLKGQVVTTILRGQTVYQHGKVTPLKGKMLVRNG